MDPALDALEPRILHRTLIDKQVVQEKEKKLKKVLGFKHLVSEVYSPPRVVQMATELGMGDGFSLDLTAPDPDGFVWDFRKRECRVKALRLMRGRRPFLPMRCQSVCLSVRSRIGA